MAQRGAVDGWDPPSVVQVTVVPGPRRRTGLARCMGLARATDPARATGPARAGGLTGRGVASLIVVGTAVCALIAGGGVAMFHGGVARPTTVVPMSAVADAAPPSAGTQAYRFPLGCLRITRTREALAGAVRRRTDPCWRYGVSVTAILRRVAGTWRLALEATSRSCPRTALPAAVRDQLAVCRR